MWLLSFASLMPVSIGTEIRFLNKWFDSLSCWVVASGFASVSFVSSLGWEVIQNQVSSEKKTVQRLCLAVSRRPVVNRRHGLTLFVLAQLLALPLPLFFLPTSFRSFWSSFHLQLWGSASHEQNLRFMLIEKTTTCKWNFRHRAIALISTKHAT